jgi:hypothetical protein
MIANKMLQAVKAQMQESNQFGSLDAAVQQLQWPTVQRLIYIQRKKDTTKASTKQALPPV